jgi:outer membrane biosynthesis protein TonB
LIKLVFKNTTWEPPGPEPEPEPEPQPEPEPEPEPEPRSQTQPAAAEMMSMPEAEGPEADAAWRALVATNPNGTVIDDFMIALPSDGTAQQGTEAGASATATET